VVVRQPVGPGYIWLKVLASFGTYLVFVTPIAFSLALRVEQLAPGNAEYLGYLTGIASIAGLVWSPVLGARSDRTRSRLGRRRPYLLAGAAVSLFAMLVMAWAPSILLLGVGWTLASIGWGAVVSALLYYPLVFIVAVAGTLADGLTIVAKVRTTLSPRSGAAC
jgi:MFS family permease